MGRTIEEQASNFIGFLSTVLETFWSKCGGHREGFSDGCVVVFKEVGQEGWKQLRPSVVKTSFVALAWGRLRGFGWA